MNRSLLLVAALFIGCRGEPVSLGDFLPPDSGIDIADVGDSIDASISDAGFPNGELTATPEHVDFGASLINCRKKSRVVIESVDQSFKTVTGLRFEGPSNFDVVDPGLPKIVIPNEPFEIELGFTPTSSTSSISSILRIDYDTPDGGASLTVTLSGRGAETVSFSDSFSQKSRPEIDFLFVIDQSASMFDEFAFLHTQLGKIDAYIQDNGVDFHIAVTNMDTSDQGAQGQLLGNPRVLDETTPNYTQVFRNRLRTESGVSPFERGLEASWLALSEPLISSENIGFSRTSAALSIFYLTDESDASPRTAQEYAVDLGQLRPAGMLTIRAIVGTRMQAVRTCADYGEPYLALVDTLSGVSSSVCDRDWDEALTDFPPNFGLDTMFPLEHLVKNDEIEVEVGGTKNTDWKLSTDMMSITFTSSGTPDQNANIVVRYSIDECTDQ